MTGAPLYIEMAEAPEGGIAKFATTTDGTNIRFALWGGGERGTVFLLPGRTEYIEKYGRVVGELTRRKFSVVVIDWRGQGLSDHIDGRTDLGDVIDFADYQQDFAAVLSHGDIAALKGPRLIFSHSMGGCIALRHLMGNHGFKAAVFCAPMWDIILPKGSRLPVGLLAKFMRSIGKGQSRTPSTNGDFYVLTADFKDNDLTTDKDHWEFMRNHLVKQPALGLGGASMRWFRGALDEFSSFRKAKLPTIPTLVMLGSNEGIVLPKAIHDLTGRAANMHLEIFQDSRHEIWMEAPDIREKAWAAIDKFLIELDG